MREALTVGVAVPDLADYAAIDEAWGIGDPLRQVEASVAGWRAAGRVPVHGRDLRLVSAGYRPNEPDEKMAAARQLADKGVFAVVGARDFTEGALWLARHGIPVIDVNAVPRPTLAAAPLLFTLRTAQDELYRAFVRWACHHGHLRHRVVGVLHEGLTRVAAHAALDELRAHGRAPAVVIDADGSDVGAVGTDVPACLERDGVDLVLGFVGGSTWIATLRAAVERDYHPAVLDLETGEHTNDVTARWLPDEIYDGVLAVTMSRVGDVAASWELAPATCRALDAYEAWTGEALTPSVPVVSGEWSNTLISADLVSLLIEGLEGAGPDLDRAGFVAGLEQLRSLPTASGGDVSFAPGEHWGFRGLRAIRWAATRRAWVAIRDFEPMESLRHRECDLEARP